MKYKCLVLDHDDTLVQTERYVGYPYFRDYLRRIRPGTELTFRQYLRDCCNTEFVQMCQQRWGMTQEECDEEYRGWKEYYTTHPHVLYPGMDRIVRRQKEAGGLVCVASLSLEENILTDYRSLCGVMPDAVYDNDLPGHQRKPSGFPLEDIMRRFGLRREEILVVDDMMVGWEMARAAGVDTAFAAWGKKEYPELCREMEDLCEYTFYTPEELEEFLFS